MVGIFPICPGWNFTFSSGRYIYILQSYFQVLMYGNSATNPVLYAFLGDQFKKGFKRAIRGGSRRGFYPQQTISTRMSSIRWNDNSSQVQKTKTWMEFFITSESCKKEVIFKRPSSINNLLQTVSFSRLITLHCSNKTLDLVVAWISLRRKVKRMELMYAILIPRKVKTTSNNEWTTTPCELRCD